MTDTDDDLQVTDRIVLVFDICSSSNILEELVVRQNLKPYRNLMIEIKKYLELKSSELGFRVYKFIGDGWILLFPLESRGESLIDFLEGLSHFFDKKLRSNVLPHLERAPEILGLTFGVDCGSLVRLTMADKREYVGRPINIASRLQAAIKDKDDEPAYKVLISKPAFNQLKLALGFRGAKPASRTLKNIRNGDRYSCMKLRLRI